MIAVVNRLPVKEGAAGRLVERFAEGRGHVQRFPACLSMEVMRSEEDVEELVITCWQSPKGFRPGGAFGRVCQVLSA